MFSQSLPNNVDFTIRFTGLSTQRECEASAVKIGDNVLRFRAPGMIHLIQIAPAFNCMCLNTRSGRFLSGM